MLNIISMLLFYPRNFSNHNRNTGTHVMLGTCEHIKTDYISQTICFFLYSVMWLLSLNSSTGFFHLISVLDSFRIYIYIYCNQVMATSKHFQGKRHAEAICHCLPLHSYPGIPGWSPIQILSTAGLSEI